MKRNYATATLSLALVLLAPFAAWSHVGHKEAPGEGSSAPAASLHLPESAITNLGIKTTPTTITDIAPSIKLNAHVEPMPDLYQIISTRTAVRVIAIAVQPGDVVTKGQLLAQTEPLTIGSTVISITSPLDGIVSGDLPAVGQGVDAGAPIMNVVNPDRLLVVGQLYEDDRLSQIKVGQLAQITSVAYPDMMLTGTVIRLDPVLGDVLRTMKVFMAVDNPGRRLLPNMLVVADVATDAAVPAVTVPGEAILGNDGHNFVFVRSGDRFERRDVTLGLISGNRREVIKGVLPDELVVIQGHYQLQYASPTTPDAEEQAH